MAIKFLNTLAVDTDVLYVDASNDKVGIGTTSPAQLLHLQKGGVTPTFTAPDSEVLRIESDAPSELSGNPRSSDINILSSSAGYSRVIFTDDSVSYGENGLYYDHASRIFQIISKSQILATFTTNGGVFLGANQNKTTADDAMAVNRNNTASGNYSFAAGELTEASAAQSAAFGYDTTASGGASFATGAVTIASGSNSFVAGSTGTASGTDSTALGYGSRATGNQSLAIGYQTTASGNSSFSGGGPTTLASGENAFAFGADVDVIGSHSAGFGRLHDIDGNENLVGGVSNVVDGDANLVGGANNDLNTKDNNLVAGGSHTMTVDAGSYNTIIGFNNEIGFGSYNLSGGQETFNFGTRSISFGSGTTASKGSQQYAFGEGTTTPTTATAARASNQFVVGKFNDINNAVLFAVGNGSSTFSRQNALTVDTNGDVGISTTSPSTKLHVLGTTSSVPATGTAPSTAHFGASTFGTLFSTLSSGRGVIQQGTSTGTALTFDLLLNPRGGNVGIGVGTSVPAYTLDVYGTGRFTGDLRCLSLIQTSQRDQKKDIADIDKTKARAIPFKEYKYKSEIDGSERKRYGVVVEDIENDYPELVHVGADGIKGVNYIDLLVKRVAELEKELEDISLTPGPKGATGSQGPAGANGRDGASGRNGINGNDHLKNVQSINFNEKSGQLEITIEGYKDPFRFNPAK